MKQHRGKKHTQIWMDRKRRSKKKANMDIHISSQLQLGGGSEAR